MSRTLAEAKHEGDTSLSGDGTRALVARIFADLKDLLGGASKAHLSAAEKDRRELNQFIYPVSIPPQTATVTAGGALNIFSGELLGPRTGQLWDVSRIAIFGLHAASEVVQVFKTPSGSTSATVAQNYVCTLTPAANQVAGSFGAFQTFGKGQCVLRAGESLQVTGAALTASEVVTFSGDATNIAMSYVGEYFV